MKTIKVESEIKQTTRLQKVQSMFGLQPQDSISHVWQVDFAEIYNNDWQVGSIVGDSGTGKTTIAKNIFPLNGKTLWATKQAWPANKSILDGMPDSMTTEQVTEAFCQVGLSSVPTWVKPYRALSEGEKFRADIAQALARATIFDFDTLVIDEYTSVLDREHAVFISSTLQRAVRDLGIKLVTISGHDDYLLYLRPNWLFTTAVNKLKFFSSEACERAELPLKFFRLGTDENNRAWKNFRDHHYLNTSLNSSAISFLTTTEFDRSVLLHDLEKPVCFSSWIRNVGKGPPTMREHRTVVLPKMQGLGIGSITSKLIASAWKALGFRVISTVSHPGLIKSRNKSKDWRLFRGPQVARKKLITYVNHMKNIWIMIMIMIMIMI